MGLNFRKSITICKGVRLNLSKSGVGVSVGAKGARVSMNSKGQARASVGIPGTGIYYTKTLTSKSKRKKSAAKNKKAEIDKKKEIQASSKTDDLEKNKLTVEEYDNYIEIIKSVHEDSLDVVDWNKVHRDKAPFEKGGLGEREKKAKKELDSYKPGFFEKLNKANVDKKREELEEALEAAREEDLAEYESWEVMHDLSKGVLEGDIDSFLEVIAQTEPFEDLVEYGSDFEVGTDSPNSMTVEFNVKSKTVVPTTEVSLTKTGKLSTKELTKTKYYDYIQDYVCSCSIRLARDIFALLPVKEVIVHAQDTELNTRTGKKEDITILSVRFTRDGFENIDFERIDPSDFVSVFENNIGFAKTTGFKEVERIS